jgi:cyclopropane fatty-acyl-phospholipid synthase-like methyltransferase
MRTSACEPRASLWNSHYKDLNLPWRSGGVSKTTLTLLRRYKPHDQRLLEIGCGTGSDSTAFVDQGFEYFGIDFSEAAIRQAIKNHRSTYNFACADFFQWTAKEPFSVIYEKGFFHGLRGVRRRNTFVRRAASLLAKDGIWLTVCGAADHRRSDFNHPAIYLRDLINPAEIYFEVLEVIKADYGLADRDHEFSAWHAAFRRR